MTAPPRSRVRARSTQPRSHPSSQKKHHPRRTRSQHASLPLVTDCLTLTLPMLPSVNRKYGHRFYVRRDYRLRENEIVESLTNQLLAINVQKQREARALWIPQATDRYIIFYDFEFVDELRQDVHNPLKPTCDLLQRAGIIYNDNRSIQEHQQKWVQKEDQQGTITVYRMAASVFTRVPLQQLLEEYLQQQQHYTIERYTLPYDDHHHDHHDHRYNCDHNESTRHSDHY